MSKEKHISKILICQLTEDELKEESRKLTDLLLQKGRLEAEKKSMNSHYSERIKDIDEEIEAQIPIVQYNQKEKTVTFRVEFNVPESGFKTLFRLDSGEVFDVEKMTDDEIQDLFIAAEETEETPEDTAEETPAGSDGNDDICRHCGAINTLSGNRILHIGDNYRLCLVCAAQRNEKTWKKVLKWRETGHQVLFRAVFGCHLVDSKDTTLFKFMGAGHSWGHPIYKAGDYEEPGTDANLFYQTLCEMEDFKED